MYHHHRGCFLYDAHLFEYDSKCEKRRKLENSLSGILVAFFVIFFAFERVVTSEMNGNLLADARKTLIDIISNEFPAISPYQACNSTPD
jgi:hypothetical protein